MGLKTGQSTVGGGNATVPGEAPIQPAQAFVDSILGFLYVAAEPLDASGKDISEIQDQPLSAWLSAASNSGENVFDADFSGNALSQTTVRRILASWAASAAADNDFTLDLGGGTNSNPNYSPEVITFQIPSSSGDTTGFIISYGGLDFWIGFRSDVTLSASAVVEDTVNDQHITIGTSDSPTATQRASKIVELWGTITNQNWSDITSIGAQVSWTHRRSASAATITLDTAGFTSVTHDNGDNDVVLELAYAEGKTREITVNENGSPVTYPLP